MNLLAITPPQERPIVIAFGGGKGGAGRSTICAEVARSMARQGQRVLCLDASWSCATLHTLLLTQELRSDQEDLPDLTLEDPYAHLADYIQETGYKNVWLATLAAGRLHPYTRPTLDAAKLIQQLHELTFDHVLIDLPPELDPLSVDLFTLSDIPILVSSPEPTTIRVTTQFLRATILRAITHHPEAHLAARQINAFTEALPLDLDRSLLYEAAEHFGILPLLDETLMALEVYLVVNLVREGAERDLGHVLSHAWHEELGVFPRFMTSVDYEDRRWFYNRRAASMTTTRGDEALSNDIERLVRHLSSIDTFDQRYPRPVPTAPDSPPALTLGLSLETSANQVRQHCRRLWEGYRRQTAVNLVFADADKRAQMADMLELLYRRSLTLPGEPPIAPSPHTPQGPPPSTISALLQAPQDLPYPEDPSYPSPTWPPPSSSAHSHDDLQLSDPPSGEHELIESPTLKVAPDDEQAPGKLIERLRRQHQLSLQDLSQRTHIGLKYLTAIEQTDLEILPRSVYLRGYLREIARAFGVDSAQLIDDYFKRLARYR